MEVPAFHPKSRHSIDEVCDIFRLSQDEHKALVLKLENMTHDVYYKASVPWYLWEDILSAMPHTPDLEVEDDTGEFFDMEYETLRYLDRFRRSAA